jgi:hypothetical protein
MLQPYMSLDIQQQFFQLRQIIRMEIMVQLPCQACWPGCEAQPKINTALVYNTILHEGFSSVSSIPLTKFTGLPGRMLKDQQTKLLPFGAVIRGFTYSTHHGW